MAVGSQLRIEALRTLAFGSVAAGYTSVGTPLVNPAQILILQNSTDAEVMFSFDGVTDHLALNPAQALVIDIAANKTQTDGFFLAEGEVLFVKRIDIPTTGAVYFTNFYGLNI